MKLNKLLIIILFFCSSIQETFSQSAHEKLEKKLFSFGVIADVQYADIEKAGKRDYRNSLIKLENCIDSFNNYDLSLIINMGDLIERDFHSFDKPLGILKKSKNEVLNVIGNHDFDVDDQYKRQVRKRLKNKNGYFDFEINNFVFIILDGTDVSTFSFREGTSRYRKAVSKLEEMKAKGANNAYTWNGGIGKKQLKWLETRLQKADQSNQKVLLFCHWPLLPENGTQLWNNREVLNLINQHKSVVSWISGHHHAGHYEKSEGIHHLTVNGMVEARSETACGIVEVYPEKLMLKGMGDQNSYRLDFSN